MEPSGFVRQEVAVRIPLLPFGFIKTTLHSARCGICSMLRENPSIKNAVIAYNQIQQLQAWKRKGKNTNFGPDQFLLEYVGPSTSNYEWYSGRSLNRYWCASCEQPDSLISDASPVRVVQNYDVEGMKGVSGRDRHLWNIRVSSEFCLSTPRLLRPSERMPHLYFPAFHHFYCCSRLRYMPQTRVQRGCALLLLA